MTSNTLKEGICYDGTSQHFPITISTIIAITRNARGSRNTRSTRKPTNTRTIRASGGQPSAKPKITQEEIAQRPLDKRAAITIGAAFLITFAFDRLICSIPPTWLIGYELAGFLDHLCAYRNRAALENRTKTSSCLACFGKHRRHWRVEYTRPSDLVLFEKRRVRAHHAIRSTGVAYAALPADQRRYDVRRPLQVVWNWFTGWLQQPFIHIRDFAEPFSVIFARFAVASRQRSKVREIGIALLISHSIAFDDHTVACRRRSNSAI